MNKLTLIAIVAVFSSFFLASCEKEDETALNTDRSRYTSNYDFFLTGSQVVPANASTASGRIEGTYDRRTKTYTYKLTWAGLSGTIPANGIQIHGPADRGFTAPTLSALATYPGGVVQQIVGNATATSGTFSGTLFVDNVVVKEADLLNGKFYIDIKTAAFPNGEIRGQIIFF
jgi:hypothetical protein